MNCLKIRDVAGIEPTTSTLSTKELGVNTADGILFINNGTEIIKIRGDQGLLQPNKFAEGVLASTNGNTSGNNWVTVLSISVPVAVSEIELHVESSAGNAHTGELRITKNGNPLPILSKQGNTSATVTGSYLDTVAIGSPLLYCKDTLLVEIRISSDASTWSNSNVTAKVAYHEVEEL